MRMSSHSGESDCDEAGAEGEHRVFCSELHTLRKISNAIFLSRRIALHVENMGNMHG